MTHSLANWLWRIVSTATYPAHNLSQTEQQAMKIEVERLPDYLWRGLGFPPIRRLEDDPWRQVQ